MAKSKARKEIEEAKRKRAEQRVASYAPEDKREKRKRKREHDRLWTARHKAMNQSSQPTTNAARASWAHDRKREREEGRRLQPVTVTVMPPLGESVEDQERGMV